MIWHKYRWSCRRENFSCYIQAKDRTYPVPEQLSFSCADFLSEDALRNPLHHPILQAMAPHRSLDLSSRPTWICLILYVPKMADYHIVEYMLWHRCSIHQLLCYMTSEGPQVQHSKHFQQCHPTSHLHMQKSTTNKLDHFHVGLIKKTIMGLRSLLFHLASQNQIAQNQWP